MTEWERRIEKRETGKVAGDPKEEEMCARLQRNVALPSEPS